MPSPMDGNWKKARLPAESISAKDWKREYHQAWDIKKTLKENLMKREDDAYFNYPAMDGKLPWAEHGDAAGNRGR